MNVTATNMSFDRALKTLISAINVFPLNYMPNFAAKNDDQMAPTKPLPYQHAGSHISAAGNDARHDSFDRFDASSQLYQTKGAAEWLIARSFRIS